MACNLKRSFYIDGMFNFDEICEILADFYGLTNLRNELLTRLASCEFNNILEI